MEIFILPAILHGIAERWSAIITTIFLMFSVHSETCLVNLTPMGLEG